MTWFWGAIGLSVVGMVAMARTPREWTPAELEAMRKWEQQRVGEGMCPHAGLPLGEDEDGRLRCRICDCGGYERKEVGGGSGAGS